MSRYKFDWVDAFSAQAFGGNGCAVVHDGADLSSDTCTSFVRETSLVECTFTGPSEVADVKVRYYLASQEIPFAGHPTIATVAAMRDRGLVTGESLVLETGAGLVPVDLRGDWIDMNQVAPKFGNDVDPAIVAASVSLPPDSFLSPPQVVSTGLPFVIAILKDQALLRAAQLNPKALRDLRSAVNDEDEVMEPFLVTLGGHSSQGDTFSRLMLAPPNPPEDPFTGSATGAMAAYLWKHGLMAKDSFVAEQGHWMGRPGQAVVTRMGPPQAMTGVKVAGRGFVLMRGTVDLPD